jgi:hypothetical protein
MVDPITITISIKAALAKWGAAHAGALIAISHVAFTLLTFEEIANWFTDKQALKESDKDNLAFTLQEKLSTGEYNTVQGIFNTRTHTMPAARTITSKHVDAKLAAIHATHEIALYS